VDILTGNVYNPSKNIAEVLDYIEKLLYTPNPKSAANGDLADL
jgi:ubiquitin-protein ligase